MAGDETVPFSSHLDELRRRLIWSLLGVFVVFSAVFALWATDIVNYVKEIAVVDRDIMDEPYKSAAVARVMPYRAVGSTWTLREVARQGGSSTTRVRKYEVLASEDGESTVRVQVYKPEAEKDENGNPKLTLLDTQEFRRSLDQPLAPGIGLDPEAGGPRTVQTEDTLTVEAGEFECFLVTTTDGDVMTRLWIAKTGGLLVRRIVDAPGRSVTDELTAHDIKTFREQIELTLIGTLDAFSVTMRVSFYAALVFAYPWVMFQAYRFVAPGLYRRERRFFQVAIPSIFVLFAAGAAFGRYILLPISIPFLLEFNVKEFGVTTTYSLTHFLNLVFTLSFGLGFVFQIPLLVAPLIRFGLLSPEFFKSKRRYTILIAIVIGAIISPTGNPIDMILAGAPVFFLVEGGVWIGRVWKRMALRQAEKEALAAAERGEKVDPEALAGGLAIDLEKRLAEFAKGGAREFARELVSGFREGGKDVESIFDDDYADNEKPPTEVKLKPKKPATEKSDPLKPDQMHNAKFELETQTSDEAGGGPARQSLGDGGSASEGPSADTASDKGKSPDQGWPDRPWDENVNEELARYIEDRISQRLQQYMDRKLRPWMERIEHELKRRE